MIRRLGSLVVCGWMLLVAGAADALAEVQTKKVEYEHDGKQLEGYLAWDDAIAGPRPGVMIVHEWWGLNDYVRDRTEQLARAGYVAFAADMFGQGMVTEHPQQAREWATEIRQNVDNWRRRAQAGLKVLREHERVDGERIAAIGYCFGGSTVLQLALSGEKLAGVVSFHGGLFPVEASQLSDVSARILICHGAEDNFIPEEAAQRFRQALDEADVDYTFVYYGGARHSFTNPDAGKAGVPGLEHHPTADQRSFRHMQGFFREIFGEGQRRRGEARSEARGEARGRQAD